MHPPSNNPPNLPTAHERTSQADTSFPEQAHTEPRKGAANVEVRWNKRCVSKIAQSCRQGNRLCKSSPNLLCDYGEKRARKQKSGACRRPEPSAAESAAQSPPGRASHTPNGVCAFSALSPQKGFLGQLQGKDVLRKNTKTHQPSAAT